MGYGELLPTLWREDGGINMNENEAVREIAFEKDANLYEKEVREILSQEKGDGESSEINNILRHGMRIIRKAREEIKHARQIEAEQVRHGRWINDPPYRSLVNGNWLKAQMCSACGALYVSDGNKPYSNHNYCAECGAEMER